MAKDTESDNDEIAREIIRQVHALYLNDTGQFEKCSQSTGVRENTIRQAVKYGKGSVTTHLNLFCWGINVPLTSLPKHIPKLRKIVVTSGKLEHFELVLQKVLKFYNIDEVIAVMELLLDKYKIESRLGLRKKPGRKKSRKRND